MTRDLSLGISREIVIAIALVTAAVIVAACGITRQSRGTGEATGFLGDYSNLRKWRRRRKKSASARVGAEITRLEVG